VHLVGHEQRRTTRHPQGLGDCGDLGEDLRGRVPSSDDHDPSAGEHVRGVVVDGVQLPAGERVLTREVRQIGTLPRASGTDHHRGIERACVRVHDPTIILPADAGDADRPMHRQLVAFLVSLEVVHDVVGGGNVSPTWAGIDQPGRGLYWAGENIRSDCQPCCQAPPGCSWSSRMTKSKPARRRKYPAARPAWPPPMTTTSLTPAPGPGRAALR